MQSTDSFASAETELRLVGVVEGDLVFGWVVTEDEAPGPTIRVARTVYDQIAEDEEGEWEEQKEIFNDVLFVDLNRLLMEISPSLERGREEEPASEAAVQSRLGMPEPAVTVPDPQPAGTEDGANVPAPIARQGQPAPAQEEEEDSGSPSGS